MPTNGNACGHACVVKRCGLRTCAGCVVEDQNTTISQKERMVREMKMSKIMATMGLVTIIGVSAVSVGAHERKAPEPRNLNEYLAQVDDITKVRFYDSDQLSLEILESRKETGTIIIERCEGVCDDAAGNGRVISPYYEGNDYISYVHATVPVTEGDVVNTYLVYSEDTDYVDDVEYRFDEIVKDF